MILNSRSLLRSFCTVLLAAASSISLVAQAKPPASTAKPPASTAKPPQTPSGAKPALLPEALVTPPGYTIGPDDVLNVRFWKDADLTSEVTVRPDGKITLQLVNDVQAAGLTPEDLQKAIVKAASAFVQEPTVTVSVKEIRSRRVHVLGAVGKIGPIPLSGPMTVSQLISIAGGLADWADEKHIVIIRLEGGKQTTITVNYAEIKEGKNLQKNNIELRPGDTMIVR
jgi:polysaccharide export outer membrane protein